MDNKEHKKRGRPALRTVTNIALKRAVELVGGAKNLSLDIGVHANKISAWLYNDQKIPAYHVHKIVKATKGLVKAEELRPDVFVLEEDPNKDSTE